MLSCGCLNILIDIYKELTILIQFSNQWGLQCGKAVFSILVSSIRLWSFFLLGILTNIFTILLCLRFCQLAVNLAFSFECLSMCVSTLSCIDEEAKWSQWEMQNAGSPVLIPGIQRWRILLPHLSSPSDLDQDPRSWLKFCTGIIIYKKSFFIECIYAHT